MKQPCLISFLLTISFFFSSNVSGAGAEQWKRVCEGEDYKSWQMPFFDFYYPEKCPVPADKEKETGAKRLEEADTLKYYDLKQVGSDVYAALSDITGKLNAKEIVSFYDDPCKIYVVTDPKRFARLKGKDDLSPADNVCVDSKSRSILVCATPNNKPRLGNSLGYGVANLVLKEYMASANPDGELCDALRVGLCAHCSGLNDVVEPSRIVTLPYLLEGKLLLPSELFMPQKIGAPEKKLYFTRQSRALVSNIFLASESKFAEYVKTVKDGNSGFRNSFQNLYVSDKWAGNYDDFCDNLPIRVFYPLTKEPMTNPKALAKWEKALAEADAEPEPPERKTHCPCDSVYEKQNHIRVHHGVKKIYH